MVWIIVQEAYDIISHLLLFDLLIFSILNFLYGTFQVWGILRGCNFLGTRTEGSEGPRLRENWEMEVSNGMRKRQRMQNLFLHKVIMGDVIADVDPVMS